MNTKKTLITVLLLALAMFGVVSSSASQQKVNVETLFWMLPADVFPEYIPQNDKEGKASFISVCDYRNGYLSLGGAQFGWEMCYWNLKDGRKLVAVNQETEEGSIVSTFFYKNGSLKKDANYKLGGEQTYQLEDFVDVSQLDPQLRAKVSEAFTKGDYHLFYSLPQKGTSLILRIDPAPFVEGIEAIPYEAQKCVEINWVNETWVKGRSMLFTTLYE